MTLGLFINAGISEAKASIYYCLGFHFLQKSGNNSQRRNNASSLVEFYVALLIICRVYVLNANGVFFRDHLCLYIFVCVDVRACVCWLECL